LATILTSGIIKSLEDIEGRSIEGLKATGKVFTQKREIAGGRLIEGAERMIEACDGYLN
jgi:hypothetical protein